MEIKQPMLGKSICLSYFEDHRKQNLEVFLAKSHKKLQNRTDFCRTAFLRNYWYNPILIAFEKLSKYVCHK